MNQSIYPQIPGMLNYHQNLLPTLYCHGDEGYRIRGQLSIMGCQILIPTRGSEKVNGDTTKCSIKKCVLRTSQL